MRWRWTQRAASAPGSNTLDPDAARFLLALGQTGEVRRAARLAEVDEARAWAWAAAVPRPPWLTRRSEAAARLFATACVALERTRATLDGAPTEDQPTLRELVMVAERFFAAALRLDREVAADADTDTPLDLGDWAQIADSLDRP